MRCFRSLLFFYAKKLLDFLLLVFTKLYNSLAWLYALDTKNTNSVTVETYITTSTMILVPKVMAFRQA